MVKKSFNNKKNIMMFLCFLILAFLVLGMFMWLTGNDPMSHECKIKSNESNSDYRYIYAEDKCVWRKGLYGIETKKMDGFK